MMRMSLAMRTGVMMINSCFSQMAANVQWIQALLQGNASVLFIDSLEKCIQCELCNHSLKTEILSVVS